MNRLIDCLDGYNFIATVGICKNAGKTTVLNYIAENYFQKYTLGITSIGYDGEKQDIITKLPKPRIKVYPGTIIATSEYCLDKSDAKLEIILETDFTTALGRVYIVKAVSEGYAEISGPSIASQIKQTADMMFEYGCEKVIVDGAAGRLSYAVYADSVVLSVGAALSDNIDKVVKRAKHITEILNLEVCKTDIEASERQPDTYSIKREGDTVYFVFRGAVIDDDLSDIIKSHKQDRKVIVAKDASAVFVNPKTYHKFLQSNGEVKVRNKINLTALTINPMSPYGKWFDKDEFLEKMSKNVKLPVYNVLDEKGN